MIKDKQLIGQIHILFVLFIFSTMWQSCTKTFENDGLVFEEEVIHISDSTYIDHNLSYNVFVFHDNAWKSVEVHDALVSDAPNHHGEIWNDWDNSKKLRDTMGYVNFIDDFNGPLKIRVQNRKGNFRNVEVRPTEYGIDAQYVGQNTVEFTLPSWEKRKISLEFDGNRYNNLFLFPNKPDQEKPNASAGNVLYYGPGEHEVPTITLTDNQTLYVDAGAKLYTNIKVVGHNVTIAGRGIISGERMRHWGDFTYSYGDFLLVVSNTSKRIQNFKISGVTLIDSPGWTLAVFDSDKVDIENVNIISWSLNADGIDLVSVTDAKIRNSFIRAYDDCISLKVRYYGRWMNKVDNIEIKNNLIWGDYARGIAVGPEAGDLNMENGEGIAFRNITIEDCIVLESMGTSDGDNGALIVSQWPEQNNGSGEIRNVIFRNITIDNLHPTGRPIYVDQIPQRTSYIRDLLFQNINIIDNKGYNQFGYMHPMFVNTHNSFIQNLVFDNLQYNNTKITSVNNKLQILGNVEVTFK